MPENLATKKATLVNALEKCRAILTSGPKDCAKWPRQAAAAVKKLNDVVHGSWPGWGPSSIWDDLIGLVNRLESAYLWNKPETKTALPAPPSWLRELQQFAEDFGGKPTDQPRPGPSFNLKTGVLVLDGQAYSVGKSAKYFLRSLVNKRAASYSELQEAVGRPDKVAAALFKQIPATKKYITKPGVHRKGKGGYSTTIQPADSVP